MMGSSGSNGAISSSVPHFETRDENARKVIRLTAFSESLRPLSYTPRSLWGYPAFSIIIKATSSVMKFSRSMDTSRFFGSASLIPWNTNSSASIHFPFQCVRRFKAAIAPATTRLLSMCGSVLMRPIRMPRMALARSPGAPDLGFCLSMLSQWARSTFRRNVPASCRMSGLAFSHINDNNDTTASGCLKPSVRTPSAALSLSLSGPGMMKVSIACSSVAVPCASTLSATTRRASSNPSVFIPPAAS
mmetsp:Transcript_10449/g.20450  ORF Transcript_10449/g.20450 Transcript_10449/m.20450 type:complete len:246 (-) Transcript_10449:1-738(-)